MVTNDSFVSRLLPGLLVAAAIFAAWWLFIRAGDHPSVPQQAPGLLDAPSSVGPMLLQASQLGPTYDQSAQNTRATTSVEIRKGQSPAATRLSRTPGRRARAPAGHRCTARSPSSAAPSCSPAPT
jgi:hypothetical protein